MLMNGDRLNNRKNMLSVHCFHLQLNHLNVRSLDKYVNIILSQTIGYKFYITHAIHC